MRLYNSLTRKKEEFKPEKGKIVRMYTCGPTVYDYAHIGNLRSFIFADLLRRALELEGYKVKMVMNITDVGHLVSDADTGEEKIEIAAQREGKTAWEIAKFYTKAFLHDLERLNIKKPWKLPRATAHIKEQISLVRELEKKGFTYTTSDGIYFNTSKLSDYGKLTNQKPEKKKAGARVKVDKEKRQPWDFALWKFSPKDKKREMEWKSPWGRGFPGWHAECSAMSRKYLGQPFDIHTGGVDHLPIHHPNEIAQSEAAYDTALANFWLHGEFLLVDDTRMGKSEGNLITLDEIEKRKFSSLAYRYFVLGAHYRSKLNFTWQALEGAQNALFNLYDLVRDWDKPRVGCAEFEARFREALEDDLNIPEALAVLWDLVNSDQPSHAKAKSLLYFDQVLGLDLKKYIGQPLKVPAEVQKLVDEREQARESKDFAKGDKIRKQIEEAGFVIEDTPTGPKLRKSR